MKLEFCDVLSGLISSDRRKYHIYTLQRVLSLAPLLNFDFKYSKTDNPDEVKVVVDLKEHGKLEFVIDVDTDYGEVVTCNYQEVIKGFLRNYEVSFNEETHRRTPLL